MRRALERSGRCALEFARDAIALDTRSIAIFRILLGLTVVFVVVHDTIPNADVFFSETTGVHRLKDFANDMVAQRHQSFPSLLGAFPGTPFWVYLNLIAEVCLALALAAGWQTDYVAPALWIVHSGLHFRCNDLHHGGSKQVRAGIAFAMLLPLDATWSLEVWKRRRLRRGRKSATTTRIADFRSMTLRCVLAQMYIQNYYSKSISMSWTENHSAVSIAMDSYYASVQGQWLRMHAPSLCNALTRATIILEGPAMLLGVLLPWPWHLRFLCYLAVAGMHLSFLLFMRLGDFPLICTTWLVLMFPGAMWDALGLRATTEEEEEEEEDDDKTKTKRKGSQSHNSNEDASSCAHVLFSFAALCVTMALTWTEDLNSHKTFVHKTILKHIPDVLDAYHVAGACILVVICAGTLCICVEDMAGSSTQISRRMRRIVRVVCVGAAFGFCVLRQTSTDIGNVATAFGFKFSVGMYQQKPGDGGQGMQHYYYFPGYTSDAPDTIVDWWPWHEDGSAPRPLRLDRFPASRMNRMPDTKWPRMMTKVVKAKRFGRLGSWICERYASPYNLTVFQMWRFGNVHTGLSAPPKPRRKLLWSHTCHVHTKLNCTGDACPWARIKQHVDEAYDRSFLPSDVEKRLAPRLYPGARVRMLPNAEGSCFKGKICANQTGTYLRHNDGLPPVRIRWDAATDRGPIQEKHNGFPDTEWTHWGMFEMLSSASEVDALRTKDAARLGELVKNESWVVMRRHFDKVRRGDRGVYLSHKREGDADYALPPLQVEWRPTNGTDTFIYWVYAMDVRIEGLEEEDHRVAGTAEATKSVLGGIAELAGGVESALTSPEDSARLIGDMKGLLKRQLGMLGKTDDGDGDLRAMLSEMLSELEL